MNKCDARSLTGQETTAILDHDSTLTNITQSHRRKVRNKPHAHSRSPSGHYSLCYQILVSLAKQARQNDQAHWLTSHAALV